MQFTTVSYLVFFLVVVFLYYLIPFSYRWILLLIANVLFYTMFVPWYTILFACTIFITYVSGILLEKKKGQKRTVIAWCAIILNLIPLLFFKYSNFFHANVVLLARFLGWNYSYETLMWLLPLGISFHTFQSISYLIEVYGKRIKAERHMGIFALYISFFPQLVAGPIERPGHMLGQFHDRHAFFEGNVTEGMKRMIIGFVKKIVIADRLSFLVTSVYAKPLEQSGGLLFLGTIAFAFQIYCDFSGYSDIAIGSARVLGFQLIENFNDPYRSASVTEFWRRWHISLSSWFRDYLYIPLGGNRVSALRHCINILVTFLVSGFWHGANWTFIVWGGLHGTVVVLESLVRSITKRSIVRLHPICAHMVHVCQIITTFTFVTFAWIFFRASSVSSAWYITRTILSAIPTALGGVMQNGITVSVTEIFEAVSRLDFSKTDFLVVVASLYIVSLVERMRMAGYPKGTIGGVMNVCIYIGFVLLILNFCVIEKEVPFIYFQF